MFDRHWLTSIRAGQPAVMSYATSIRGRMPTLSSA